MASAMNIDPTQPSRDVMFATEPVATVGSVGASGGSGTFSQYAPSVSDVSSGDPISLSSGFAIPSVTTGVEPTAISAVSTEQSNSWPVSQQPIGPASLPFDVPMEQLYSQVAYAIDDAGDASGLTHFQWETRMGGAFGEFKTGMPCFMKKKVTGHSEDGTTRVYLVTYWQLQYILKDASMVEEHYAEHDTPYVTRTKKIRDPITPAEELFSWVFVGFVHSVEVLEMSGYQSVSFDIEGYQNKLPRMWPSPSVASDIVGFAFKYVSSAEIPRSSYYFDGSNYLVLDSGTPDRIAQLEFMVVPVGEEPSEKSLSGRDSYNTKRCGFWFPIGRMHHSLTLPMPNQHNINYDARGVGYANQVQTITFRQRSMDPFME